MIFNLNEPTEIYGYFMIHPVKYIGVWWQMFVPNRGTWNYINIDNVHLGVTDYSKRANQTATLRIMTMLKNTSISLLNHGFDAVLVEGWNRRLGRLVRKI